MARRHFVNITFMTSVGRHHEDVSVKYPGTQTAIKKNDLLLANLIFL